jgi:hypothetical protein
VTHVRVVAGGGPIRTQVCSRECPRADKKRPLWTPRKRITSGPIRSIRVGFGRARQFLERIGQIFFHRLVDAARAPFERGKTRPMTLSQSKPTSSNRSVEVRESSIKPIFLACRVFQRGNFFRSNRCRDADDCRNAHRRNIECRKPSIHPSLSRNADFCAAL